MHAYIHTHTHTHAHAHTQNSNKFPLACPVSKTRPIFRLWTDAGSPVQQCVFKTGPDCVSRLLEKGSKGDLTENDIHGMLPMEHSCNVVSAFAPAWNCEVEKAKIR